MVDFSIPGSLVAALVAGALLPLPLWLLTRVSALKGKNPLQFLLAAIAIVVAWLLAISLFPFFRIDTPWEVVVGMMALAGATMLWLEIWGLMSRGYTLSILVALAESDRPMTAGEIALAYRSGDGLDWILRHRLGGLEASGMIYREGDAIELARPRGVLVARLYKACIAILGLRRTG